MKTLYLLLFFLFQIVSSTLLKVSQDMLKEGDCHGLDFQNCLKQCKGIKHFKQCEYYNKKAKCQCE